MIAMVRTVNARVVESKLLWLAMRNFTADWGRAAKNWRDAMNLFAILYADRFTRIGL